MKKTNIFILAMVLSVSWPSFVFAAWWNPFTWFSKSQESELYLEINKPKEIPTIRIKVEQPASTTVSTTTVIIPSKKVEVEKKPIEVPKKEVQEDSEITALKARIEAQLKVDALAAQAQQQRVEAIKAQQAIDRANEEAAYEQARRNSAINAYNEKVEIFNSKVEDIKQKILDLNKKYLNERDALSSNGGITKDTADGWLANLSQRYQSDYERLRLEYEQVLLDAPVLE